MKLKRSTEAYLNRSTGDACAWRCNIGREGHGHFAVAVGLTKAEAEANAQAICDLSALTTQPTASREGELRTALDQVRIEAVARYILTDEETFYGDAMAEARRFVEARQWDDDVTVYAALKAPQPSPATGTEPAGADMDAVQARFKKARKEAHERYDDEAPACNGTGKATARPHKPGCRALLYEDGDDCTCHALDGKPKAVETGLCAKCGMKRMDRIHNPGAALKRYHPFQPKANSGEDSR